MSLLILNLLVVLFLFLMVLVWSQFGLFDGFVHLIVLLASCALAIAVWEPLTVATLLKWMPEYAWGVGLLLPFLVWMILLRVLTDKLIPAKLEFKAIANQIGGGALGLVSGVITAGFVLVGIGFMPFGPSIAGYQPYTVDIDGTVIESGGGLWIGVDKMSMGIVERLVAGSFVSGHPLHVYRPDLRRQAAIHRLRPDAYSRVSAHADAVRVTEVHRHETRIPALDAAIADSLGNAMKLKSNRIVVAETEWKQLAGTFDGDSTLRVPPTQVRLIATEDLGRGRVASKFYAPLGFSRIPDTGEARREFTLVHNDRVFAYNLSSPAKYAWVFVIPESETPAFLQCRGSRLELPVLESDAPRIAELLGRPSEAMVAAAAQAGPSGPSVGEREGVAAGQKAASVSLSNKLPLSVSKNEAPSFEWGGKGGNQLISGGPKWVKQPKIKGGKRSMISEVLVPGHQAIVRLELAEDAAKSIPGAMVATAIQVQGIWLEDDRKRKHFPVGYVLHRKADDAQRMYFKPSLKITSAKELPIKEMRKHDPLYLYFFVPKGAKIVSYHMGARTKQEVNITAK